MKYIISIFVAVLLLTLSTTNAKAIIVVVPTILIPIVSIVVWIVGALATPIIAVSAIYFKMKKKSPILGIFFGLTIVLVIGIIITLIFKLVDPQRPIY